MFEKKIFSDEFKALQSSLIELRKLEESDASYKSSIDTVRVNTENLLNAIYKKMGINKKVFYNKSTKTEQKSNYGFEKQGIYQYDDARAMPSMTL